MKILIVDDEALARLRLRTLIADVAAALPALQARVIGEAADAAQARSLMADADAVLLDIRMPGSDGLQLAAAIRTMPRPPAVIFVTAHGDHALQAFELEAVDYLTKPVRRERLQAALQRVQQRMPALAAPASAAPEGETRAGGVLVISERGRTLRLPIAEVLYLRAEQKVVLLRTADRSHMLFETLAELEQRLLALGGDFLRVHRNALVARRAIRALELHGSDEADGWAVRVAPLDEWLAVSRRQVAAVRAALLDSGEKA